MLDYVAWIERAKAFLRQAAALPGKICVTNFIKSVEYSDYEREVLAELRGRLPEALHRFVSDASARCCFRYEWFPPPEWLDRVRAFYPAQESICGGADFCEKAQYSNFANQNRLEEVLSPFFGMMNLKSPFRDGMIWLAPADSNGDGELTLGDGSAVRDVVFTNAGGVWSTLSDSFDQFLVDWESIRYVSLSREFLGPWLDADTGMLRPHGRLAEQWRALLDTAAAGRWPG